MLEPPSDVNWLLSALAQASAAMIAIIGGLLVSRYVTLHSEQMAARRRVADLQRRLDEASMRLREADESVATYLIDDALLDYRVFEAVIQSEGDIDPASALLAVDNDGSDLDERLVAERVKAITAELDAAFEYLDDKVAVAMRHESWADFRRRHKPPVSIREVWDWAYDAVCEERENAARDAELLSARGAMAGIARSGFVPDMSRLNLSAPLDVAQKAAQASALRARANEARAETMALEHEKRLAAETLNATRQPEGFALALQVLSTLAVVGMAVPVVIMGFAVVDLTWWVRAGVIALFLAGVGLLLRFLFVYASFLREGGRDELPSSVVGLLGRARRSGK